MGFEPTCARSAWVADSIVMLRPILPHIRWGENKLLNYINLKKNFVKVLCLKYNSGLI